ncbi:DUF2812 domain-containing protein [Lysinibacillus sp. 2017]|uniref:DUF2812 domain-containing protein n=1 Tax=unclassified Lysinibacillus TaxID=2636778 RepID=UPI000D52747F|nr:MULTISPECIES: DUF2812 domain-containing protein [unclassified Lysinibacillus]AWE07657.1 DUF2812 domain-containing protein [Lysinibacillus sp. 2017]TGN36819.1 DUF2812 domain-containing protein [Lysinibacillus sp. S2017]
MNEKKFVISDGIAFSEKRDLKVLKRFAAKGWIVKRYKGFGYELEKREPEFIDYSIDIRNLAEEDKDEYFAMFEFAGWEHVCSSYDTHLFKAPVGTTPIYSDNTSKAEKLMRLQKSILPATWLTVCFMVLSYFMMVFFDGTMGQVSKMLFNIFMVLVVPCVMMYVALTYRRARLQGE